ncbi:MAG TPA: S49 family peptidase, partial [Frankiaceae bacterium]|nr:S49 family peptidase [Frankiaceae bacterium]
MASVAKDLVRELAEAKARRTAPLLLELDLTLGLFDGVVTDPVGMALAYRKTSLRDVVDGLRRAGSDPRVRGLVARVGGPRTGLARAQELRDAVLAFRRAGKPAVAWAETLGEHGVGTVPYYLASAFDEVWLQPSGHLNLTGVAVEVPFLRDALAKAGITPEIGRRHKYKGFPDTLLERGFTPAHREATERVVASVADQVVAGIAEGRRLPPERVRALVDQGPLLAREAVDAGLVDRLAYRDEVYDEVRRRLGADVRLRYVGRYRKAAGDGRWAGRLPPRPKDTIALVHVTGAIRLGRSGRSPLTGTAAGSDTVAAALRRATRDDDVKAIVLRVDSPGGSYVASDTIWRQVVLARRAGTPVVVSMGNVAGSGGYFVSTAADVIVAEPGTLTGSIGVFAGKQVLSGLLGKLGVTRDSVAVGEHALMFSTQRGFSEGEWERLNRWLDVVYDDFTAKVAQGRRLSRAQVEQVARGRVWTGADARERGL